jgi:hypothetical protein
MSVTQTNGKPASLTASRQPGHCARAAAGRSHRAARLRRMCVILPVTLIIGLSATFAAPAPRAAAASGLHEGAQAQVIWEFLNLRTGPSLNNAIIVAMPEGAVVTLIEGPFARDGFNWWHVSLGNILGFAADAGLAPAAQNGLAKGVVAQVVNTPFLHLRASPSLECEIIATMPEGATVTILSDSPIMADGFQWWKVSFDGLVGFAVGTWLAPVAQGTPQSCVATCLAPDEDAVVVVVFLNLRRDHSLNCDILAQMNQGTVVHIIDGPVIQDGHQWWRVNFQGMTGFAAGDVGLAPA